MVVKPLFFFLLGVIFCSCATNKPTVYEPSSETKRRYEAPPPEPLTVESWYFTDGNLSRCYEGAFNDRDVLKLKNAGIQVIEKEGACSTDYLNQKVISFCDNLRAPEPKSLFKVFFYGVEEAKVNEGEKVLSPEKICDELRGQLRKI